MPKFRKKPVVIEALQLRWDNWNDMCLFAEVPVKAVGKFGGNQNIAMEIKTLEGTMTANENDWIIKGVNGELYPCKPDIFEKTYEAIDDATITELTDFSKNNLQ